MKNDDVYKTIKISDRVRVLIEHDQDEQGPGDWDNFGKIAYTSTRYCLGSEEVSRDRMEEIGLGIISGELIGLPVFAYIHSGVTIRTGPFSCPWDSGQSGWVYCTKEEAIKEFGNKICTAKVKALKSLEGLVSVYDQWFTGDVYGYVVQTRSAEAAANDDDDDWEDQDSLWSLYGSDYAESEGREAGIHELNHMIANDIKEMLKTETEQNEKQYWEERDVCTA